MKTAQQLFGDWSGGSYVYEALSPVYKIRWERFTALYNNSIDDAVSHAKQLGIEEGCKEVLDWERWAKEVCDDFRIPFDNHKVGLRLAITYWMAEAIHQVRRKK